MELWWKDAEVTSFLNDLLDSGSLFQKIMLQREDLTKPEKIINIGTCWKCGSYQQMFQKHRVHLFKWFEKIHSQKSSVGIAQFLNNQLYITREDQTKKPSWLQQLQKSSILLYFFVKKCSCKWNCHCAVILPLTHHMWSLRIFETRILWTQDIGWDHQAQIWR